MKNLANSKRTAWLRARRLPLALAAVAALAGPMVSAASADAADNAAPGQPTGLYTSPDSGAACGATEPYTTIGNTDVTLGATVSDPDDGIITARFAVWPTGFGTGADRVEVTTSAISDHATALTVPKSVLTGLLADDGITGTGTFSWAVRGEDGSQAGPWSTECHFAFDSVRPSSPPGVVSVEFPDGSGGWPANTGAARTPGTFTLSSGGVDDVVSYTYSSDWDPTRRTVQNAVPGAPVDVVLTPPSSGPHTLSVFSSDPGGNRSDTFTYFFYANAS